MAEYILGLNSYHADSAACLLRDGELLIAIEEERLRRVKHFSGFPSRAIDECLRSAGCTLADITTIAINSDPAAHRRKKIAYAMKQTPDLGLLLNRLTTRAKRRSVQEDLVIHFPNARFAGEVVDVEHHLAHMASAHFCSPFTESTVLSIDGFGDFASTAWGQGQQGALRLDGQVFFPHSLGVFYQALTQFLGFPNYGDEYKVMGLAPYGENRFREQMHQIVGLQGDGTFCLNLEYFRHQSERIEFTEEDGAPKFAALYSPALEDLLGQARVAGEALTQRHRDIAHSLQSHFEQVVFHLLQQLHRRYGGEALALAGGCAMNSVANGKIPSHTPYHQVYVQAAAGDAGGAIGAALVAHHQRNGKPGATKGRMAHAYVGVKFCREDIENLLAEQTQRLNDEGCTFQWITDEVALCKATAERIAAGDVVGWFQGAMEWGPRALGNRSILGDPRRADMKQILNEKIKRRESFRPFAPSVLQEAVNDWFSLSVESPFMSFVVPLKEERRCRVPAITHVDGTGRLQTVDVDQNPRYHQLIQQFSVLTGVPMVLNTSFNENEPIVCAPNEALECFLRTKMDLLVLGDCWIQRTQG